MTVNLITCGLIKRLSVIRVGSMDVFRFYRPYAYSFHPPCVNITCIFYSHSGIRRMKATGVFMIKPMFTFAPDTKIKTHPVKFGSGDWTAVIGELEGTFSKPMQIPGGKTIPPTNKKFKLSMCTVGHWKGGKMTEEYLFWDNATLMQQIGLGQ